MLPAKNLNVRGGSLERATAKEHSHAHHNGGGGHEARDLECEAGWLSVRNVEASHSQSVLHLLLVVDMENVVATKLRGIGEGGRERGREGGNKIEYRERGRESIQEIVAWDKRNDDDKIGITIAHDSIMPSRHESTRAPPVPRHHSPTGIKAPYEACTLSTYTIHACLARAGSAGSSRHGGTGGVGCSHTPMTQALPMCTRIGCWARHAPNTGEGAGLYGPRSGSKEVCLAKCILSLSPVPNMTLTLHCAVVPHCLPLPRLFYFLSSPSRHSIFYILPASLTSIYLYSTFSFPPSYSLPSCLSSHVNLFLFYSLSFPSRQFHCTASADSSQRSL